MVAGLYQRQFLHLKIRLIERGPIGCHGWSAWPRSEDHRRHLEHLLRASSDKRYVRVDNKPLLVVYNPDDLPESRRVTDLWRDLAVAQVCKDSFWLPDIPSEWDSNVMPGYITTDFRA